MRTAIPQQTEKHLNSLLKHRSVQRRRLVIIWQLDSTKEYKFANDTWYTIIIIQYNWRTMIFFYIFMLSIFAFNKYLLIFMFTLMLVIRLLKNLNNDTEQSLPDAYESILMSKKVFSFYQSVKRLFSWFCIDASINKSSLFCLDLCLER